MSSVKGTVELEIRADRFKSGARQIEQSAKGIETKTKSMGQSASQAGQKIQQMSQQGSQNMQKLGQSANQTAGNFRQMGQASNQAAGQMQRMGQSTNQAAQSTGRLNAGTFGAAAGIGAMGASIVSAEASLSNYVKAEQKVEKATVNLSRATNLHASKLLAVEKAELKVQLMREKGLQDTPKYTIAIAELTKKRNEEATAVEDLKVKTQDLNIANMDHADTQKLMASSLITTVLGTLSAAAQMISAKRAATVKDTVATKANTKANLTGTGAIKAKITSMRASIASTKAHIITTGRSTLTNIANNKTFSSMVFDVNKAKLALNNMSVAMKGANLSAKGLGIGMKALGTGVKGLMLSIGPLGWAIIGITTIWQAWEENLFGFRDAVFWVKNELVKLWDKLKMFLPVLGLIEEGFKAINNILPKTEDKLENVEDALLDTESTALDVGDALETVTDEAGTMNQTANESANTMQTFSESAEKVTEDLGDISERARGLTQALKPVEAGVYQTNDAITQAVITVKGLDAAYNENMKIANQWGLEYKGVVHLYGEGSKEVSAFTEIMRTNINNLFGGTVPDTLPKYIKEIMKDAADSVVDSKDEMLSAVQEIEEFLKKNQSLVSDWADLVKNKSIDAETRMLALQGLRGINELKNEVDYSKLEQKRSTDLNFFNKYISSIDVSKAGWYNDPRILGDMFKHFSDKSALEAAIKTSIAQTGGAFQKEFAAILKNHTGQTLGGSGPTSTNFNTQTKSIYNNPNFETGGRPAGGHQTTVGSRNNKQEQLNSYNKLYKDAKKIVNQLYGYDAGPKVFGNFGRHNYYSAISRYLAFMRNAQTLDAELRKEGTSLREISDQTKHLKNKVHSFGTTTVVTPIRNNAIKALIAEHRKKQRKVKYDKLKTYASTVRSYDDLSQIGIGGISEAEALTKEFGSIQQGDTTFIQHLKQLEQIRIKEQQAMQAEIRRIAAEQARIKAQQERVRKQNERLDGIESEIKANPYNIVNILKRLGWTESNLKGLFSRDYNLDAEEERILTIAQIGQREISQQVTT